MGVGYLIIEKQYLEVRSWSEAIPWNAAYEYRDVHVYDLVAAELAATSELRTCLQ